MEGTSAIATIGTEKYTTEIKVNSHELLGDEPVEDGGEDRGPSPGDFLRMSLACCTAITLRMYANRKQFDVQQIRVTVSSMQAEYKTIFNRNIEITGSLNEEQRKRMVQIANACPVHKTLTNPIEIETGLDVIVR
jgi:putative redox protein